MKHAIIRYHERTTGFALSKSVDVPVEHVFRTVQNLKNEGNIIKSIVYVRGGIL
jgi:hypothetical protein